jgi:alkyl sulfatase BDS1-like metallo-beta-lactamase superfamily hydrolase
LSFLVCQWRSAFLAGAAELRHAQFGTPPRRPPTSSVP